MSAYPDGGATETVALSSRHRIRRHHCRFAASIAVAQNDIKRILAYSTVSQLGYMMMGLGMGGVAVGMFHSSRTPFSRRCVFMGAGR